MKKPGYSSTLQGQKQSRLRSKVDQSQHRASRSVPVSTPASKPSVLPHYLRVSGYCPIRNISSRSSSQSCQNKPKITLRPRYATPGPSDHPGLLPPSPILNLLLPAILLLIHQNHHRHGRRVRLTDRTRHTTTPQRQHIQTKPNPSPARPAVSNAKQGKRKALTTSSPNPPPPPPAPNAHTTP